MTTPRFSAPRFAGISLAALTFVMAGCAVGPNYVTPTAPKSLAFKEAPSVANGWVPAQPLDGIPKGAWWSVFGDPYLDGLESRVAVSNQTIAAAEAGYRAARALTAVDRASFFPTLTASSSGTRSGSGGAGSTTTSTGATVATSGTGRSSAATSYGASLGASWAPDLWGKIRRTVEADQASAQASAADLANATLSAQTELASDYIDLRILDEETRLYGETIAAYQKSLQVTQNQYDAGTAARADVITAQTQLLSAQASAADIGVQRTEDEHAIALLIGVAPSELTIAPAPLIRTVPVAPVELPSTLLQRRPDIASAERKVKQENALIGVQVAAYYPDITLSGSYGFSAANLGKLFNAANDVWSFGGDLSETLLDFGARRGRVREARANYDQSVATYRQTVLTAFQGVEDQLAALRVLEGEAKIRDQALASARQASAIALNEYRAGTVDYTTVVTAQATALSSAQSVLTVLRARQVASVTLIENLGGGWTTADLPKH